METLEKKSKLETAKTLMGEVRELVKEYTESVITIGGKDHKLSEWLTLAEYARKHDIQLARVQRWVDRGIVPRENVVIVPELNNLKLIKNQRYATRAMS